MNGRGWHQRVPKTGGLQMGRGALCFPLYRDLHPLVRKKRDAPGLSAMATHCRMDPYPYVSHRGERREAFPFLVAFPPAAVRSSAQTHRPQGYEPLNTCFKVALVPLAHLAPCALRSRL